MITVSGVLVEALVTSAPAMGVSGAVVEVLATDAPAMGVSGVVIEVLTDPTEVSEVAIDGALVEVLVTSAPALGVSGVLLEALTVRGETSLSGVLLELLVGRVPAPEVLIVPTYPSIAEKRLGRDVALDESPTPTGDWPTVAGRACLHAALQRRILTSPGELVHRAEYGAGLELQVGALSVPSERARFAASARVNLLRDTRIEEAKVSVAELGADQVEVSVQVRPVGEPIAEAVSVVAGL